MKRWISFLIVIAIGALMGMYYGWEINPVEYVDTTLNALRMDYKTDYVLMVAEAYHVEQDMGIAVQRLSLLGEAPPAEIITQAILYTAQIPNYSQTDLAQMQTLLEALQTWDTYQEAPLP